MSRNQFQLGSLELKILQFILYLSRQLQIIAISKVYVTFLAQWWRKLFGKGDVSVDKVYFMIVYHKE